MNAYLKSLRDRYESLRTSIEGLQARAVEDDRALTEDELRSVQGQGEAAAALYTEIESLTEIEARNRKVAELAAALAPTDAVEAAVAARAAPEIAVAGSRATTQDRDPGHYTRASAHSFFGDLNRARNGDSDASRRLEEHNRAMTTGGAGAGVVAPRWLQDEYEALARQGRKLAGAVRNIDLGADPRPITLPRQLVGTDPVLAEQAAENEHPSEVDSWGTGVDTVVPKPTSGIQVVSRQMLDMGSPAVDQLIYGDMLAAYNLQIERKVGAAVIAAAGDPVVTYPDEAAFAGGAPADAVLDAAIAVRDQRKLPADIVAMGVVRYGRFLKLKDSTGRPLMPAAEAGRMNVVGVGAVDVDGRLDSAGVGVVATDGINVTGTYPDDVVVLRAADTILFESAVQRFRYEEVAGPESVKLGIWAYSAVIVRQAGRSAKRVQVQAA
ncbi:Phage major capsid [Pseudonocardia sp. Ae168_Ps1]|uniref:phage major capsid protein n=1 Tax=unclassified Pseudonocardia TaxID=2619320 RepID=UPI00094B2BF2|nr:MULTISPECIES: phage major capsid protein [unclassified Pseudonocardia]OLL69843.1 Phage major capsid [Pseudonocardia sp. Ae150A_Ps1]OLL69975.1 Phage major capsid [Pseudonocardia sp. Ae168_Ps1]OLL89135.1 Phage major capsid [Pseudonocardia sp. Ae356_Ps1]